MDKKAIGTITAIITIIIIAAISGGIGYYAGKGGGTENTGPDYLSGSLKITGSTTVKPLADKWVKQFIEIYPNVRITAQGGGSGKGVADVKSGLVDIGMSSSDSLVSKEANLIGHRVAFDGIMVVVNKNNPAIDTLDNIGISLSTLQKIYDGTITNWNEVPGINVDAPLNNLTRAEESGTAETFANFLVTTQGELDGPGQKGNQGVKSAVEKDQNSLAYVGAAYAFGEGDKLEEIPVDGNNDNIIQGYEDVDSYNDLLTDISNYPIKRSLWFATKKGELNAVGHAFINWCRTEGQEYVSEIGYIPITGS